MHKLTNKFRKLLLSAVTIGTVGLLAGCGVSASGVEADNSGVTESQSEANGSGQNYAGSDSQKLQIVATIFPEYDWVKEILGEQAGERGRNCGGDAGRRWTRPRRRTHP